jgi:hypothetical protein
MALPSIATGTANKVLIQNMDALVLTSKIPSSLGDQAGSLGGVVSNVVGAEVSFMKGSSKVIAQGKPVVTHTAPTGHNGASANVPGVFCTPGQMKVLCAP